MFSYTQWLDELIKAAGHKYIKRVPYQSGGKMRYRYIYNVTHTHGGKHVLDPDHMQVGTKLMLDATSGAEVHGHIQSVSGDKVTFVYDDGPKKGESVTMSKEKLASELDKVHGISGKLDAARKKQSDAVAKLKEKGASANQIARAEARLKALGGDTPKAPKDQTAEQKRAADALRLAITEARKLGPEDVPDRNYAREELDVGFKLANYALTQQGTARRRVNEFITRYHEAVKKRKKMVQTKPRAEQVILLPQMLEAERALLDEMEQQLLPRQNATVQEQPAITQPPRTSEIEAKPHKADKKESALDSLLRRLKEKGVRPPTLEERLKKIADNISLPPIDGLSEKLSPVKQSTKYNDLKDIPYPVKDVLTATLSRDADEPEQRRNYTRGDGYIGATDGFFAVAVRSKARKGDEVLLNNEGKAIRGSKGYGMGQVLSALSATPPTFTISEKAAKELETRLFPWSQVDNADDLGDYLPITVHIRKGVVTINHEDKMIAAFPMNEGGGYTEGKMESFNVDARFLWKALTLGGPVTVRTPTVLSGEVERRAMHFMTKNAQATFGAMSPTIVRDLPSIRRR